MLGDFNIGFPGQYLDDETGLWYNWHRYYDFKVGRYIQADPVGLLGGSNTFTYAASSPLIIVDPKGLQNTYGLSNGGMYRQSNTVTRMSEQPISRKDLQNAAPLVGGALALVGTRNAGVAQFSTILTGGNGAVHAVNGEYISAIASWTPALAKATFVKGLQGTASPIFSRLSGATADIYEFHVIMEFIFSRG